MKQILNCLIALLISMGNLAKPSSQKRVNDRSEKNDGRNSIERFALNSRREPSKQGRNLLVMITVYRQRKLYSRPQRTCSRGQKSGQTQRRSESKK